MLKTELYNEFLKVLNPTEDETRDYILKFVLNYIFEYFDNKQLEGLLEHIKDELNN